MTPPGRLEATWIERVWSRAPLAALVASLAMASSVEGQSDTGAAAPPAGAAEARRDVRECWRFGFGSWDPALDWQAAGHAGRSPAEILESARRGDSLRSAPRGRGNATWSAAAADTALLLFPDWWPAGIAVRLEPAPATADTVRGTATALVADGRVRNPVSRVVAIRRACGAAVR